MFLFETIVTTNTNGSGGVAVGAANLGHDVVSWLQSINWASPSWDLFIVLFFLVTVFLYGMSLGRDRIIVILVSIYMALAVVSNAPILGKLDATVNLGQFFAFRVTTFLGVFVLLFFLLSRSALLKTFGSLASGSWWQVFLFSVFHVGLLVSITLSFLPPEAITHLAPVTRTIFASDAGRFFWIIAPIFGMALLKGEH
ncbi:MAG TPA: hypothetical protein VL426_07675 [Candidatus Binatia bacterium]|jgi:hypothetical protein|nr:hypothetical protein [Candidatus Binatia bacterium]